MLCLEKAALDTNIKTSPHFPSMMGMSTVVWSSFLALRPMWLRKWTREYKEVLCVIGKIQNQVFVNVQSQSPFTNPNEMLRDKQKQGIQGRYSKI